MISLNQCDGPETGSAKLTTLFWHYRDSEEAFSTGTGSQASSAFKAAEKHRAISTGREALSLASSNASQGSTSQESPQLGYTFV